MKEMKEKYSPCPRGLYHPLNEDCKCLSPQPEECKYGCDSKTIAAVCPNHHTFTDVEKLPKSEEFIDAFYELYEDGRKHHNAPQSYIDYFKARAFLLDEIYKAEEKSEIKTIKEMALFFQKIDWHGTGKAMVEDYA